MDEILNKVCKCIRNVKPIEDLSEKTILFDGFLDSFDLVMLVHELEEMFDIKLDDDDISRENFTSIETLIYCLKKKNSGS